jgi:2-dehydro-3-deoxyphosphogluconate aldolase / (4S)-4-hydroxy-2-oxoglutarate aldolase
MDKLHTLKRIKEVGLLAVIRGSSEELTLKMVDALVAGGVIGIEITYSTPNAAQVVRELKSQYGEGILLGMGTLTEVYQAEETKSAGAGFIVSPICQPDLIKAMVSSGLLVMAGALSPTEVFLAHKLGADVVKIFPGSLAGPSYLKALKGPFPEIATMPTGGVSKDNVRDWFAAGAIAVGAGSELCPPALAKAGKFSEITGIAREFLAAVNTARSE